MTTRAVYMGTIGMVLFSLLFAFQNCGGGGSSRGANSSLAFLPSVGDTVSQQSVDESADLYNGGNFGTNSAPLVYNSPISAASVISENRIISNESYSGSLLINHEKSYNQLVSSGENYDLVAVVCTPNLTLNGNLTNTIYLNVGACPYDIFNIRYVDQYVLVNESLVVEGDLQVLGMLVIGPNATLQVSGRLMVGAGPSKPGVIIIDGGSLAGDVVLGNQNDSGTIFWF